MNRTKLCIFSHVEKCGGTTLIAASRNRAALAHCDLVMRQTGTNSADTSDLRRAMRAYPKLDFLAGHCVDPGLLEQYRATASAQGYKTVHVVTTLRAPISRLLSDYVHDVTRRDSTLSLADYLNIEWKQNYLTKFFGNGDLRIAKSVLSSFDCVDTSGSRDVLLYLANNGFAFADSEPPRTNVYEQQPPACLAVKDGVTFGKYCISQANVDLFNAANQDDIALFDWVKSQNSGRECKELSDAKKIDEKRSRPTFQRLYRNIVYKLLFLRRRGFTPLPRNSQSAEKVGFQGASIWSRGIEN